MAVLAVLGTALTAGCGLDGSMPDFTSPKETDDTSEAQSVSIDEIAGRIQQPTGTVDASTVAPVAEEFASASTSSLGGSRNYAEQVQMTEQACESGGTMSASGTASETGGDMSTVFTNCCVQDCCYDGNALIVYSDAGEGSYNYCADYDIAYSCNGEARLATYAECTQADGSVRYSVEVGGATYTVTGSYADGNGELTIVGANGTWACTYTNGSGSCAGAGGDFTF
jgi:hypothetical protein